MNTKRDPEVSWPDPKAKELAEKVPSGQDLAARLSATSQETTELFCTQPDTLPPDQEAVEDTEGAPHRPGAATGISSVEPPPAPAQEAESTDQAEANSADPPPEGIRDAIEATFEPGGGERTAS